MWRLVINRKISMQQTYIDWIRAKLDKAERSDFTDDTRDEILKQSKSLLEG